MKCKICGKKTTWETSVGRPCYIVCNKCVEKIAKAKHEELVDVTTEILKEGLRLEGRLK